ncbi:hypothetical protein C8J57DRAFT_1244163 [Mycena rebaudengoi]|nr:hypothetical protein C8J57DRAFT_1244163 [Mycena rebaudengoi]
MCSTGIEPWHQEIKEYIKQGVSETLIPDIDMPQHVTGGWGLCLHHSLRKGKSRQLDISSLWLLLPKPKRNDSFHMESRISGPSGGGGPPSADIYRGSQVRSLFMVPRVGPYRPREAPYKVWGLKSAITDKDVTVTNHVCIA